MIKTGELHRSFYAKRHLHGLISNADNSETADHIRELIFKLIFLPNVNIVDRFYGILLKVINWCHKASDYRWGTYILSWSIYGLGSVPSHLVCTWLLLLFKLR